MSKDIELEAIVKIEEILEGMKWEQKHRILNFVRDRAVYDPVIDGGLLEASASPIIARPNQTQ